MINKILAENPILKDPSFRDDLDLWAKIRDAVEASHPDLSQEERGELIGRAMAAAKDLRNA